MGTSLAKFFRAQHVKLIERIKRPGLGDIPAGIRLGGSIVGFIEVCQRGILRVNITLDQGGTAIPTYDLILFILIPLRPLSVIVGRTPGNDWAKDFHPNMDGAGV